MGQFQFSALGKKRSWKRVDEGRKNDEKKPGNARERGTRQREVTQTQAIDIQNQSKEIKNHAA